MSEPNNLEADRALESGQTLKEILPFFPNKVDANRYLATYLSRRYASVGPYCVWCNQPCHNQPIAFIWRANLNTAKTVFVSFLLSAFTIFIHHIQSRYVVVEFVTHHRFCPKCQQIHRRRSMMAEAAHYLLFIILILLLFMTVPPAVLFVACIFVAPDIAWNLLLGAMAGLILLFGVVQGYAACRRWLIPESLRLIRRSPFFLQSLQPSKQPHEHL